MSYAICEIWTREDREWDVENIGNATIVLPSSLKTQLLGYTYYQGSVDMIGHCLRQNVEDWRSTETTLMGEAPQECEKHEEIAAWAYSDYGGTDHWPVQVCLACGEITGQPYEPDYGYAPIGYSDEQKQRWKAEVKFWKEWREADWPKDGPPPGVVAYEDRR